MRGKSNHQDCAGRMRYNVTVISYELKRSARARCMRLSVLQGGSVVVTAPSFACIEAIETFVNKHVAWIARAVRRMAHYKLLPVSGRRAYLVNREAARAFIHERVAHWRVHYGFIHGRIAIKDTRRLWGSCSRKGNLNFSYTLLFLPHELADYIIVHELCHLNEHNHSPRFWALVARAIPDYSSRRRELRRYAPRA